MKPATTVDVAIIGGGIIGCSIALRLAQARLRVCVIERGEPGCEASHAAAGMIAPQGETVQPDAFFELGAASRDLYPKFVSEVEEMSGESVGYRRDGALLVAISEREIEELDHIYQGQTRAGLKIEKLDPQAVRRLVPELSEAIQVGLFISNDQWLDNESLMVALVRSASRLGVTFHSHFDVTKLNIRNHTVESVAALPFKQETTQRSHGEETLISASHFVLAAGSWSAELLKPLGVSIPLTPCRGQMIEFDTPGNLPMVVRAGIHYLVPRSKGRVVAGTTAEYVGFEKAVTGIGLQTILEGTSRIAPAVKQYQFRRAWAGFRPDTPDHLPVIGYAATENLLLATGHFRNGILLAPVTAQIVSNLILTGSTDKPIKPYEPGRFAH